MLLHIKKRELYVSNILDSNCWIPLSFNTGGALVGLIYLICVQIRVFRANLVPSTLQIDTERKKFT